MPKLFANPISQILNATPWRLNNLENRQMPGYTQEYHFTINLREISWRSDLSEEPTFAAPFERVCFDV